MDWFWDNLSIAKSQSSIIMLILGKGELLSFPENSCKIMAFS